ncbi:uncharacterized protein LOC111875154, partial [Cryptotermes secundus]|uniref:uncharacterized protein LOC111875154 n=1 Tax=Cryptotermes secundus TaxID=105785 RepID=UPI001454C7A2
MPVYNSQHLPPHNVKMFIQVVESAQGGLSSRLLLIHLPLICKGMLMSPTQASTELCIMTGNLPQLCKERQKIMLALRDIDQGKLDYSQQDHSHLQIIHAALDHGKYSAVFSYTILKLKN